MTDKKTKEKKMKQVEEKKKNPSQLSLEIFKDDHMIDSTGLHKIMQSHPYLLVDSCFKWSLTPRCESFCSKSNHLKTFNPHAIKFIVTYKTDFFHYYFKLQLNFFISCTIFLFHFTYGSKL